MIKKKAVLVNTALFFYASISRRFEPAKKPIIELTSVCNPHSKK